MTITSHAANPPCPEQLLADLNAQYLKLHEAKEVTLWGMYMDLKTYVAGTFEGAEKALSDWRSDASHVAAVNAALSQKISDAQVEAGLKQWKAFFDVHTFADPKLHDSVEEMLKLEAKLLGDKKLLKLTYTDATGATVPATITALRNAVVTEPNEESRKTAWEALSKLEVGVLDSTFIEIIKERRAFAKLKGAKSYYDYRTLATEQMTADEIFDVLDALEVSTRGPAEAWVKGVSKAQGADSLKPWNFDYAVRGDLDREIDPYFPFADAVRRWGTSFAGMGIDYREGKVIVDLIDRDGKFSNGFIRARKPAYQNLVTGKHSPVFANFTSNAVIGKVGAGLSALKTAIHEGGHWAHFSNIATASVAASQEEPPTSIAGAETHSMFLDHMMYDPTWLKRYAVKMDGTPMPDDLIEKMIVEYQSSLAWKIRSMLVVPYFERQLYDMPEADLTPKNILKLARDVEKRFLFLEGSGRPVLTVSHTHSAEAAAYYHGYVLAELAVWQTREYLLKTQGNIVDNKAIGPLLAKNYWAPGNSVGFSKMIRTLTGDDFSADATGRFISQSSDDVRDYVRAALKAEKTLPRFKGPVQLNATIIAADGDTIISEMSSTRTFEEMAQDFSDEIQRRETAISPK